MGLYNISLLSFLLSFKTSELIFIATNYRTILLFTMYLFYIFFITTVLTVIKQRFVFCSQNMVVYSLDIFLEYCYPFYCYQSHLCL